LFFVCTSVLCFCFLYLFLFIFCIIFSFCILFFVCVQWSSRGIIVSSLCPPCNCDLLEIMSVWNCMTERGRPGGVVPNSSCCVNLEGRLHTSTSLFTTSPCCWKKKFSQNVFLPATYRPEKMILVDNKI
jgi:hypothetical protein